MTIEDVKYVLSNHYQDTIYDPYGPEGDHVSQRTFRTIGINRTSQTAILQLRPNKPQETTGIQWISYGSMPYNTAVPFFTQVDTTPDYFANTTAKVTTDSFYWANRIIAGLADPSLCSTMLVIWTITKKRQWPGDMRASRKSIVHLQQVKPLILRRKTKP